MATVLIIATEQVIGDLLAQLTDLAGHIAQFRCAGQEASEAVRSARPDVVMPDAGFGRASLDAIARAAADVGAAVVYFAATMSAGELRRFALERGAKYFALPAGPKLLRQVLGSALGARPGAAPGQGPAGDYRLIAAAAAVARARALAERSAGIQRESRALRAEHEVALADCRRTYGELRDAVIAYTRELRSVGVPPDRTLELVREVLRPDPAESVRWPDADRALDDATEWCLHAYYAA